MSVFMEIFSFSCGTEAYGTLFLIATQFSQRKILVRTVSVSNDVDRMKIGIPWGGGVDPRDSATKQRIYIDWSVILGTSVVEDKLVWIQWESICLIL